MRSTRSLVTLAAAAGMTAAARGQAPACSAPMDPDVASALLAMENAGVYSGKNFASYCVTISFHTFCWDDGSHASASQAELDAAIVELNAAYTGSGIMFVQLRPTWPLYSTATYNQLLNAPAASTCCAGAPCWQCLMSTNPIAGTINVYVMPDQSINLCGNGSFSPEPRQGVMITHTCLTNNTYTFTHEVSHYLDLYHTFHTGIALECPDGLNCHNAGDLVCDTGAEPEPPYPVSNCTYVGTLTRCNGEPFTNVPVRNIMGYNDYCRNELTQGQFLRARNTIVARQWANPLNINPGWINPNFCGLTCYANCDGSTVAPLLNVNDYMCFQNAMAAAQSLSTAEQIVSYANCDGSTTAPVLNVNDYMCFMNRMAAGCP